MNRYQKEQARKIAMPAQFDGAGRRMQLWKLQRKDPATGRILIHPSAGGTGPTWIGTEEMARATAGLYPEWELVPG